MIARPDLARRPVLSSFVAALLSAAVSTGLLGAVGGLFARDGAPFERIVAAERDCVAYAYVSEREACLRIEAAGQAPRRGALVGRARAHERRPKERLADAEEGIDVDCTPIVRTDGGAAPAAN